MAVDQSLAKLAEEARESDIEPLRKFEAKLKPYWRGIASRLRWPMHAGLLEGINNRHQGYETDGLWLSGQPLLLPQDQGRFPWKPVKNQKKLSGVTASLAEIDSVTPGDKLHKLVEPFYPEVVGAGRPPIAVTARMPRMYVAHQCFGLSDEGVENAIYDSQAIRAFVGIDLSQESAPDLTTLLKFRHLIEANDLTRQIFDRSTDTWPRRA